MEKGSCEAYSLLFSAREPVAELAELGLIAFREAHDEVMDARLCRRGLNLRLCRIELCDRYVLCNRIAEEHGVLGHIACHFSECRGLNVPHILPRDSYRALLHIPKAHQEL